MGQQHSHSHGDEGSHGHSHGGKPCHGHSPAAPPPQNHGHSHGGKPCHGHGHAAPQQEHGHSHGGKPCHGHGHSAPQNHGHSHGGKPCHGHGNTQPPHVEQRMRALQLFFTTMLSPKLPIIFEKFHPSTDPKPALKTTATYTIPDNAHEVMTVEEFKAFLRAYLTGIAKNEGHNVLRESDVEEMLEQFQSKMPDSTLPQPMFIQLAGFVLARTSTVKWEAMGDILQELGLGFMQLPKIPMDPNDAAQLQTAEYCKSEILPHLTEHIKGLQASMSNEQVVEAIRNDIVEALPESTMSVWKSNIQKIPVEQLVHEFLVEPTDTKIHPALLAYFVSSQFIAQMLNLEPSCAVNIVAKWGIELHISDDAPSAEMN